MTNGGYYYPLPKYGDQPKGPKASKAAFAASTNLEASTQNEATSEAGNFADWSSLIGLSPNPFYCPTLVTMLDQFQFIVKLSTLTV